LSDREGRKIGFLNSATMNAVLCKHIAFIAMDGLTAAVKREMCMSVKHRDKFFLENRVKIILKVVQKMYANISGRKII